MPEILQKLRPDRDLQCYFERPSAIAALSEASASGFTVSGCWRQQFDWAVVEWNRDNVIEHPALRNLPDGDLSGIRLSYEEERVNCIAMDSALYATVDWPFLRVWAEAEDGVERLYKVPLKRYAAPVAGDYAAARMDFELVGTPAAGDYIELAWLTEHYNYQVAAGDTTASAIAALAQVINQNSPTVAATAAGARITLVYSRNAGANANRIGAYGMVHGTGSAAWTPSGGLFRGGESPTRWRVDLDFSALRDEEDRAAPMQRVRKLRWTWSADLQAGDFVRSEFSVVVSNWSVTGARLTYEVAGPGSRRIEDDSMEVEYFGEWKESRGNFSGGSIHDTTGAARLRCTYRHPVAHRLYLGTRRTAAAGEVAIAVDGGPAQTYELALPGEDVLCRVPIAELAAGEHTVEATHGGDGTSFYFDFLEMAVPCPTLPVFPESEATTLATDWDTDHSIAIAPERTVWLMRTLGFTGRANHYVGAIWFYELKRPGQRYASATVEFSGSPEFSSITKLWLGPTLIEHVNLIGDTAETVAKAFELMINAGTTGVWARAEGSQLTIIARAMGAHGNGLQIRVETTGGSFVASPGEVVLSGGEDGKWRTDLVAEPRINRAARDWSRSYYRSLARYGIDVAAAFSLELQHGDDGAEIGIAQLYPDGRAAWLNTPALQTNFSPASTSYWKQVHADMAAVMREAGVRPYLQFGEVQWWYFANESGMPCYDEYTMSTFESRYGRAMRIIRSHHDSPGEYEEELEHLSRLIGEFTDAVMAYVRAEHPDARFEVLYPPDVNDTPLNKLLNLPRQSWTPAALECFKTENFTFTGDRNLNKARESLMLPAQLGFGPERRSHLIGIGEYTTPWNREHQLARGEGAESVVLFALDQFCLIGYDVPLRREMRRSVFLGA